MVRHDLGYDRQSVPPAIRLVTLFPMTAHQTSSPNSGVPNKAHPKTGCVRHEQFERKFDIVEAQNSESSVPLMYSSRVTKEMQNRIRATQGCTSHRQQAERKRSVTLIERPTRIYSR